MTDRDVLIDRGIMWAKLSADNDRMLKELKEAGCPRIYDTGPRKLYLAATFSSRPQMALIADQLREKGFEITSEWVYGGEDGLTREQIAVLDLAHVDAADTVVSFTYPRGTLTSGGGRHVEFGYALAKGKRCVVIGSRENVFHHAPGVEVYATLEEWLAAEGKGT